MSGARRFGMVGRFASVGVANTMAGLAIIAVLRAAGLGELGANAAGYALALLLAFTVHRRWTFRQPVPVWSHAPRYALVVALAWLANAFTLVLLLRAGVPGLLAQAAGVLPYVALSYVGCRYWVFAAPSPSGIREHKAREHKA